MIHAWNLGWIIPLSALAGFVIAAIFTAGGDREDY